jgi:uncharacterized surface protein with fasciclin (FAS1) repeats
MKLIMNKPLYLILQFLLLFSSLLLISGCEDVAPVLHDVDSQEQTITQYVLDENFIDRYSLFGEVIVRAGLQNLLSVRGPYTLFLPDNNAVIAYYKMLGIASSEEMDPEQCKELVYNHLTDIAISSGDIGLGALLKVNALGDFLSSEFSGPDIYINKKSLIINRDIVTANGIIHAVDKVIQPVRDDIATVLEGKEGYSIFYQGLIRTGLIDTLRVIEFEYGKFKARTRFTILAVSDDVYRAEGISSVDDLIIEFTEEPDKVTQSNNGFYKYMEYHCIQGAWFMNHLQKRDYPNISNENFISVTLDDDYEINKVNGAYTSFDIAGSNIPAKNGVLHSVDGILPSPEPKPWRVVFDVTDYIDFRESDFYKKRETLRPGDNIFQKFSDGENTFEFIKWTGDYLQYYYRVNDWKASDYINGDCLSMSGFWSIEVTTPRIMKGKYEINAFTRYGPDCLIYIDGVLQEHLYKMSLGGDNVIPRYIGTVDWTESERHTIKLANINSGLLFYDRLEFVPVSD